VPWPLGFTRLREWVREWVCECVRGWVRERVRARCHLRVVHRGECVGMGTVDLESNAA
jgi:hypothetical protein